jgi:hypothetical protein
MLLVQCNLGIFNENLALDCVETTPKLDLREKRR